MGTNEVRWTGSGEIRKAGGTSCMLVVEWCMATFWPTIWQHSGLHTSRMETKRSTALGSQRSRPEFLHMRYRDASSVRWLYGHSRPVRQTGILYKQRVTSVTALPISYAKCNSPSFPAKIARDKEILLQTGDVDTPVTFVLRLPAIQYSSKHGGSTLAADLNSLESESFSVASYRLGQIVPLLIPFPKLKDLYTLLTSEMHQFCIYVTTPVLKKTHVKTTESNNMMTLHGYLWSFSIR